MKARNLCLSVCLCVCVSVCLCMYSSNISADQDQTDLRVSTWLLHGSRVCHVAFVWTAMILLIIYFINALPIQLALLTVATTVTCAPDQCRAQTHDNKRIYTCAARAGLGFCRRFGPVLFCASELTVVD